MRVYISGPMRGAPECNFPAFDQAAWILTREGYTPVSPAELDRAFGFNEKREPSAEEIKRRLPEVFERDVSAVCRCDAIALLPGWWGSRGAWLELTLAEILDMPVILVGEADNRRNRALVTLHRLLTQGRKSKSRVIKGIA